MAQGRGAEAIAALERAAEISPLPDYLWSLADALRAQGREGEAGQVERRLVATGAQSDPRTFSLFLSSRRQNPTLALRLAQEELENRHDIFTYDAVAWAQLASDMVGPARENIALALAAGTQDARLFQHAAEIAAAAGDQAQALEFSLKARALEQSLLPSERQALARRFPADARTAASD